MSELRSILEQVTGADLRSLTNEELAEEIVEVCQARDRLDVYLARCTKTLADRAGHQELGYASPTAFLCHQTGMSPGHAKQVLSVGKAAHRAPHAHAALVDGRLSFDQARHLFRAAEALPDVYPQADEALVEIVEGLDAVDTGRAVEYWRQSVDGPGEISLESQQQRRGVSASWTVGGMLYVDGWMTTTAGEAFLAGIEANIPPRRDGDVRTPRQRRHDALENLCRDWLDNGATPQVGGEKPHINLHADLASLRGIAGGLHETETGQIVDIDTLRMLACDCTLTRIVFGPDSEVLDVGRQTRVWSISQRRAIVARDRHCQGPGCRAQPRHCDIHHTHHWADGGETTVENGKLYCRPCHILEHARDVYHRRRRTRT